MYKQMGNYLATAYIRACQYCYLGWLKLKTIAFSSVCAKLGLKHKPIFYGTCVTSQSPVCDSTAHVFIDGELM